MTVTELKQRKRELGYTNQMVADRSGVPLGTVQKIFGNITKSPRYETLKLIEKALFPENHGGKSTRGTYDDLYEPMKVAEDDHAYQYESDPYGIHSLDYDPGFEYRGKKQGEFTTEDIMAFPEGTRIELIDGRIYDLAPPTSVHQVITMYLSAQIFAGIEKNGGDCTPVAAPVGVRLNADDDRNFLEPDLVVVCDKNKIHKDMICGAPDFVAEVLSPSTKRRDLFQKLMKYQQAGVREYWIINPDGLEVMVYHFESLRMTGSYSFDDVIPLEIFAGAVEVDFRKIRDKLEYLFG